MKKIILLLAVLAAISVDRTSLFAASFDCGKAKTAVENMICSDEELSKLDEEMGKTYKEALSKIDDKDALKREQKAWIRERDMFGVDTESLLYDFYRPRINELNIILRGYNDKVIASERNVDYLTYGDVLENQEISFARVVEQDIYKEVRPANNFVLIGGSTNPVCKETLALFNEQGTYNTNATLPPLSEPYFDNLFWYLDNSGLVVWEAINTSKIEFPNSYVLDYRTFSYGLEYTELDIDADGVNEFAYRMGTMLNSAHKQLLKVFDKKPEDNNATFYNYREKEWKSTIYGEGLIYDISLGKKSIDILYPKKIAKPIRKIDAQTVYWNLYKTKTGVVMVSAPEIRGEITPEFLVFSLHRDKLATLECIMMPKKWQ